MFRGLFYISVSEDKKRDQKTQTNNTVYPAHEEAEIIPKPRLPRSKTTKKKKTKTKKQTKNQTKTDRFPYPTTHKEPPAFVKVNAEIAHTPIKSAAKTPKHSGTQANKLCCKWSNECAECTRNKHLLKLSTTSFSNYLWLLEKNAINPRS